MLNYTIKIMNKFIEIPSLNYDTIDEIIEKFKEYKKHYGGDATFNVDMTEEDAGYGETYTAIYQGFTIKDKQ